MEQLKSCKFSIDVCSTNKMDYRNVISKAPWKFAIAIKSFPVTACKYIQARYVITINGCLQKLSIINYSPCICKNLLKHLYVTKLSLSGWSIYIISLSWSPNAIHVSHSWPSALSRAKQREKPLDLVQGGQF